MPETQIQIPSQQTQIRMLEQTSIVINPYKLAAAIGASILVFKLTPWMIDETIKSYDTLKNNWGKMSKTDKVVGGFLFSGMIAPYFPIAFFSFIKYIKKKGQ